jgi:hypothetical protein
MDGKDAYSSAFRAKVKARKSLRVHAAAAARVG